MRSNPVKCSLQVTHAAMQCCNEVERSQTPSSSLQSISLCFASLSNDDDLHTACIHTTTHAHTATAHIHAYKHKTAATNALPAIARSTTFTYLTDCLGITWSIQS